MTFNTRRALELLKAGSDRPDAAFREGQEEAIEHIVEGRGRLPSRKRETMTMNPNCSPNTQAILLLTAPLITGRCEPSADLLTLGEYKRLARHLHQLLREPADLLLGGDGDILQEMQPLFDSARLQRLLTRGFALSQAIDRWQTRAVWVVSRADPDYPQRLRQRLKDDRPAVLYGCGDRAILNTGGLAVVGSREVDDDLIEYTRRIGRLAATSRKTLVSGGARGIDKAAMLGALEAGGRVSGVMADSLEKAAMNRENRRFLMDGQLVLVSPYDPSAGFNVGNAMQRNKLIYALADAALVVNSDFEKGGTWAGAVEQLDKLRFVPIYVRSDGQTNKALTAMQGKGALPWSNPSDVNGFIAVLENPSAPEVRTAPQPQLALPVVIDQTIGELGAATPLEPGYVEPKKESPAALPAENPADALLAAAKQSILRVLESPKQARGIAEELRVTEVQIKAWLGWLVDSGAIEKTKSAEYRQRTADLIDLCGSAHNATDPSFKP